MIEIFGKIKYYIDRYKEIFMATGLVISLDSGVYKILSEDNKEILLKARGKLRKTTIDKNSSFNKNTNKLSNKKDIYQVKLSPKVGDLVIYEKSDDTYYLDSILPRKNELIRPDIANVDQILLVFSAKRPDMSYFLLDLFITNLEFYKIRPIIIISKIDLCSDLELEDIRANMLYYQNLGYTVFLNNSKEGVPSALIPLLEGKITVLSGQTGAGKSTFINALIPGFKLETDDISLALNRGKHTTRRVHLYKYFNGLIGDTPGFSKLDLFCGKEELKDTFIEFKKCNCRFRDCKHLENSKDCMVREEVGKSIKESRYNNYIKMYEDLDKRR